jgi:hypothetical protein
MIENHVGLEQARRQLQNMEEVVAELMREADSMHPTQLSLQLEGPMEMIRQLRAEIDEYLGIKRAEELLSAYQN